MLCKSIRLDDGYTIMLDTPQEFAVGDYYRTSYCEPRLILEVEPESTESMRDQILRTVGHFD